MKYPALFDNYRGSERGKNAIDLFTWRMTEDIFRLWLLIDYANATWQASLDKDVAEGTYWDMENNLYHAYEDGSGHYTYPQVNLAPFHDEFCSREAFENFIDNLELRNGEHTENGTFIPDPSPRSVIIKQDDYRRKASAIPYLSLYLFYCVCESDRQYDYGHTFFKPILLPLNHSRFVDQCAFVGIELPPLPRTSDYKAYCMYYYDICKAITDFQIEEHLTDAEVCACIYDYAAMSMQTQQSELPQPTNVWLTGASRGDFAMLDALGNGDQHGNPNQIWACNERTRRGDVVVIYCTSPRSYIHSIWRANSGGMFNPFDYYHCRTTVTDGILTPHITNKDLQQDPYFSSLPIVRKNLQGVNGWELTAEDYTQLIRLIQDKGGNISPLPQLYTGSSVDFGTIANEKDVEEHILIPLLTKLGYSTNDWVRQLKHKAGRNEKAIPDFVFFPKGERHLELAPMLIEAKYDMSSMREFNNAYRQALSYAQLLQAKIFAVCDKERLVVYQTNKGSSNINAPIFENHWQSIYSDSTTGATLKQIIGKEVVSEL